MSPKVLLYALALRVLVIKDADTNHFFQRNVSDVSGQTRDLGRGGITTIVFDEGNDTEIIWELGGINDLGDQNDTDGFWEPDEINDTGELIDERENRVTNVNDRMRGPNTNDLIVELRGAIAFRGPNRNDSTGEQNATVSGANVEDDDYENESNIGLRYDEKNIAKIRTKLPELMEQFCPWANICTETEYDDLSTNTTDNETSCCTACSCLPDCQTTQNCCFPQTETNNTNDTTKCYSTLYPERDNSEQLGHLSYKMVDASSNDCANKSVAPWGSFYPVYSKSRRKIYKNSACAAADGVSDWDRFNAYVACVDAWLVVQGGLLSDSVWKDFGSMCDIWFEFPLGIVHSQEHVCYKKLIDTCPNKFRADEYFIPRGEIIEACSSGLLSPYKDEQKIAYRNVFCAMCNGRYNQQTCPYEAPTPPPRDTRGTQTFVASLESWAFDGFGSPYPNNQSERACLFKRGKKVEGTCRPVLCPKGHTRNPEGECKLAISKWFDFPVSVFLHLYSRTSFSATNLTRANFTSRWLNTWDVKRMYYFRDNDDAQKGLTKNVMVHLHRKLESVSSFQILRYVDSMRKNGEWVIKTANGSLELKSKYMDARNRYPTITYYEQTREIIDIYAEKKDGQMNPFTAFTIDSTAFCDQVNLKAGEFTRVNRALYNNLTDRFLLREEFYYPNLPNVSLVTVCLKGSGLRRVQSSSGRLLGKASTITLHVWIKIGIVIYALYYAKQNKGSFYDRILF